MLLSGKYGIFFSRARPVFLEHRWSFSLLIILSIGLALSEGVSVMMLVPVLDALSKGASFTGIPVIGRMLSIFLDGTPMENLVTTALILAGVLLVRGGLQFATSYISVVLPLKIECEINRLGYEKLLKAGMGYIDKKEYGELQAYLHNHTIRFASAIKAMADIVSFLALVGIYFLIMLLLSWQMTLMSFAFVAFVAFVVKTLLTSPLRGIGIGLSKAQKTINGLFFETMQGMRLIRLRSAESQMENRYGEAVADYFSFDKRRRVIAVAQSPILMTCAGLFICFLIIVGANTHPDGDTEWVGLLLVFVISLYRMLTPAAAITASHATITSNHDSFDLLDKFFKDADSSVLSKGGQQIQELQQGVQLKGVTFSYEAGRNSVLKDVNIDIRKGKMIALVGPSGAGKSTVVALLSRFYDPDSGEITADGIDLKDLDLSAWRKRVSVVTQDVVVFNDTVKNNLAFGLGDVSFTEIREAAKFAAADDFINELPDGYNTVLGDRGVRLSGGQRQRLAIARAVLADTDLIIFDEATSHLDSITEKAVQSAIESCRGKKTLLVIAHRLATIQQADEIVVMKDGKVIETGSHLALLRQSNTYRDMIEHQKLGLLEDEDGQTVEA